MKHSVRLMAAAAVLMLGAGLAIAGPGDWCAGDCVRKCNSRWGYGTNEATLCINNYEPLLQPLPKAALQK